MENGIYYLSTIMDRFVMNNKRSESSNAKHYIGIANKKLINGGLAM
jgi:hypothetical protein